MKKIILFLSLIFLGLTGFSQRLTLDQVKTLWEPRVFPSAVNIDSTFNAIWALSGGGLSGTSGNYAKFTSSTGIGNANLIDKGRYVTLPSGKRFGNTDTTSYFHFNGEDFILSGADDVGFISGNAVDFEVGQNFNIVATSSINLESGEGYVNTATTGDIATTASAGEINTTASLAVNFVGGTGFTVSATTGDIAFSASDGNFELSTTGGQITMSSDSNLVMSVADSSIWAFANDLVLQVDEELHIVNDDYMSIASDSVVVNAPLSLGDDLVSKDKVINVTAGDDATINSIAGRFRKDASGTTFTLTNSFITANSIIQLTYASDPGNAGFDTFVVAGAGSAVITFSTSGAAAAPQNSTDINFFIIN